MKKQDTVKKPDPNMSTVTTIIYQRSIMDMVNAITDPAKLWQVYVIVEGLSKEDAANV